MEKTNQNSVVAMLPQKKKQKNEHEMKPGPNGRMEFRLKCLNYGNVFVSIPIE